ncbi:MAG: hypothetical protein WC592_02590 [Candidatus Omnitrophota bacterium]
MNADDYIGKGSEHIAKAIAGVAKEPPSWQQLLLQEYLKVELNRELIESQRKHQDDSIKQMKHLVYATWGLVVATLLLVLIKH